MISSRQVFEFIRTASGRSWSDISRTMGKVPQDLEKVRNSKKLNIEKLKAIAESVGGTASVTITVGDQTLDLVTGAISQAPQNTKSCPVSEKIFPDATK